MNRYGSFDRCIRCISPESEQRAAGCGFHDEGADCQEGLNMAVRYKTRYRKPPTCRFPCGHRRRLSGEREEKGRPPAWLPLTPHLAVVALDDALYRGQTDTGARIVLTGVKTTEWLEEP